MSRVCPAYILSAAPRPHLPPSPRRRAGFNTVKKLDVTWSCAATPDLTLSASVPVAATATVVLPYAKATPAGSVTVTEGGTTVWANGAYVPGVPGVTGASLLADVPAVAVAVGSGDFAFALEIA